MLEDFTCKLSRVESSEKWFGQETAECRACQLAPLASLYLGELELAHEDKLADDLKRVFEDGDVLTITKTMDTIKNSVGQDVKHKLEKLDCFSQSLETQDANKMQ